MSEEEGGGAKGTSGKVLSGEEVRNLLILDARPLFPFETESIGVVYVFDLCTSALNALSERYKNPEDAPAEEVARFTFSLVARKADSPPKDPDGAEPLDPTEVSRVTEDELTHFASEFVRQSSQKQVRLAEEPDTSAVEAQWATRGMEGLRSYVDQEVRRHRDSLQRMAETFKSLTEGFKGIGDPAAFLGVQTAASRFAQMEEDLRTSFRHATELSAFRAMEPPYLAHDSLFDRMEVQAPRIPKIPTIAEQLEGHFALLAEKHEVTTGVLRKTAGMISSGFRAWGEASKITTEQNSRTIFWAQATFGVSVLALLVSLTVGVWSLVREPSPPEGITREQASRIVEELQGINQELRRQQASDSQSVGNDRDRVGAESPPQGTAVTVPLPASDRAPPRKISTEPGQAPVGEGAPSRDADPTR